MSAAELARIFAEGDVDERHRALARVPSAPPEARGSLLIRALGDVEWRVRKEAVRVTASVADATLIDLLVQAIVAPDGVGLRNAALEALGALGAKSSAALRAAYERVDVGAKKFVVLALGEAGDVSNTDVLLRAVAHGDPNLVASAIDALARLGGMDAEQALVELLSSPDPFQRMGALDGLDRLRARVPYEALAGALEDPLVRPVALPVLGRCGDPRAVAPLVEALEDDALPIVASATPALVDLYEDADDVALLVERAVRALPESARSSLARLLREGERGVRGAAATLLVLAREPSALATVMALGADGLLPSSALSALSSWGIEAVAPLLAVYDASQGGVRASALETAAGLAVDARDLLPADAAAKLRRYVLDALADADEHVRRSAARSLAWWAAPDDARTLVELVCASDEDVSLACGQALELLAQTAPAAVSEALDGRELSGGGAAALVGVVAKLGGHGAVARLSSAMSAQDPAVRRAAIAALASLDEKGTVELLSLALADEHADVRAAAARALGRSGEKARAAVGCIDALLLALDGDEPRVRAEVAEALGRLGVEAARTPLAALVRADGDASVVLASLSALSRYGGAELEGAIERAALHTDEEVVKAALRIGVDNGLRNARALVERALAHAAWDVRIAAVQRLASYGDDDARATLRARAARESDAMVVRMLNEALENATEAP